ncbi:MAG: ATPase [Mucilaginibacter sp.]|nr:ATPase [Mucilaginibacter sp.]
MGKIITLAHQKGGVGKSALALNLALCFKDQLSVALIDSDIQGSIFQLKDEFPELDILAPEKISEIPENVATNIYTNVHMNKSAFVEMCIY